MSFWKFEFKPTSAIDTLLEQEDVRLTQILNEEDVLQECKVQNRKLIDFLVLPHNMEELVTLVSQEPPNTEDERMRFKLSHVACEILTSEVCDILDSLCSEEKYLVCLWDFLDRRPPLNPLCGSFVSRVLSVLLTHKSPVILKFIQERENFLNLFFHHLSTSAISDLLLQMIAAPDANQSRLDLAMWLSDNGIVQKLIDLIQVGVDEDLCMNVAQLLGDVVRVGRESYQMAIPSPIVVKLEEQDSIERLLANMLDTEEKSDIVIVSGISFLLSLIEPRRSPNPFDVHQTPVEDDPTCLQNALGALVGRLGGFRDILTRQPNLDAQDTTFGRLDPPFGNTRLQVLKLFVLMLSADSEEVNRKFVECEIFSVLLDLFVQYPWNNFLHLQVEQCINAVLDVEVQDNQENATDSLQQHLFRDCFMLKRLLEAHQNNDISISTGSRRQGYMGHLIRLVNSIKKWYESRPGMKDLIQSYTEEEVWTQWSAYISGPIAECNLRNEMMLGGERTLTSSFDDSEEDFDPHKLGPGHILEKEYSDYRNALFVAQFEDDFVSDILDTQEEAMKSLFDKPTNVDMTTPADELQSEFVNSFESVCTARIRQFDESESEVEEEHGLSGDPWSEKDILMNSTFERNSSAMFSSSDDDDSDNLFDLQTKKLSSEGYFESFQQDRKLEDPQQQQDVKDRSEEYLTGSLGADSRTHYDLSKAGLGNLEEDLVFRDRMMSGDSDDSDDSDSDIKAVVGLSTNLDWAKEVEPMDGEGWADFTANEEMVRAQEKEERRLAGTTGEDEDSPKVPPNNRTDNLPSSSKEEDTKDVDLASDEVKQLLSDATEELESTSDKVDHERPKNEEDVSEKDRDQTPEEPCDMEKLSEGIGQLSLNEKDSHPQGEETPPVTEKESSNVLPSPTESSQVPQQPPTTEPVKEGELQEMDKQEVGEPEVNKPELNVQDVTTSEPKEVVEHEEELQTSHDSHVTAELSDQTTHHNDVKGVNNLSTPVDRDDPGESHLPNGPCSNSMGDFEGLELEFDDFPDDLDDDELSDNFSFLQKGMISKTTSDSMDQEKLIRIKQEAQEACRQYEQETQTK